MSLSSDIIKHISNLPGWSTSRKLIIFESDDWGSIRMPSYKTFETLKAKGLDVTSRYNQFDTLESADDLISLFEVLQSVKDKNGKSAVFTPISLVANPDFEKIEANDFQNYYYEPFTETQKRYHRENSLILWKQGIYEHLFVPEFHGREHLNVQIWLRDLQNNVKETRIAFDYKMWGFSNSTPHGYLAAFDIEFPEEIEYQKTVIAEGLELFRKIHGYNASLFVPPNGPFNSKLEESANSNGIQFISTPKLHNEPQGFNKYKKRLYWLGKQNKFGQHYITRNAYFEPCQPYKNWIDSCLKDIEIAFNWYKPAIISTHRVNYIGSLDSKNQYRSLKQLKQLLKTIILKWPNVEFITSSELGNYVTNK